MGFAGICSGIANQLGRFAGKTHNAFSSTKEKLKDSANLPEKIRNAMFEKLTRTLCHQAEFVMTKISERMEVIDEVARPFYEKVEALKIRGHVSENDLWQTLNSIEAAKKLSKEEKTLLVSLFGQITGAQKSKYVDAVVVESNPVTNTRPALTSHDNGSN